MEEFKRKLLYIDDDDLAPVIATIGLTMKSFEESVDLIEDWFNKQPHFPKDNFDREYMKRFLALNKFSVEKTKRKLENLLTARTVIPELLGNRNIQNKEFLKAFETMEYIVMPKKTEKNERVHLSRLKNSNPDLFDSAVSYKIVFMCADMRLRTDNNLEGDIIIYDLTNYKLGHVVKMTPLVVKKFMKVLEGSYSAKIKAIHIINLPSYAYNVLMLIKSLIKQKLADRIFVHSNQEDLLKFIPREVLPKDLGGDFNMTRDEISDAWVKNMQSNEWIDWFKKMDQCKTDEAKRPKNQGNEILDCTLGIEGTFRKLDID